MSENIKPLSWYERELEKEYDTPGYITPAIKEKYEKIADELADKLTIAQEAQKRVQREQAEKQKRLIEEKKQAKEQEKERLALEHVEEELRQVARAIAGEEFEEWLEKALKLYTIDDEFTVTSIALGPNNQTIWHTDTYLEAKRKIVQLIKWKHRDHFERGHDFAYDPDTNPQTKET